MNTTSEETLTEYTSRPDRQPLLPMPLTRRDIVILVIVAVLLCGAIALVSARFEKGSHSHRHKHSSTTTATPAVPAKERRRAPDGVFFLTERVTLTAKSGVISFAPGTAVRLISRNGDMFRVTDGQVTLEVSKENLTKDVHEAAVPTADDFASQQASAAHIRSEIELHRQRVNSENAQLERDLQAIEAARREAQRIAAENMITPAEANILNLREVHRDISGNIIYGVATDGISVGPGQVRSFREQVEFVKNHQLPDLTADESRERWREDYLYTQQHKTPDVIVVPQWR
jgi:hypothetical protein